VEEWNNAALASGAGSQQAGADLFIPTILSAPVPASAGGYGNHPSANPGAATPPLPAATPVASSGTPAAPPANPADNSPGR